MGFSLKKLPNFQGRSGPLLFVIMDGIGIGKNDKGNAFFLAQPSNINKWVAEAQSKKMYAQLKAHGPAVGLPAEEDMGNSEVGHNAMGSGQIYNQGAKLVNESIESGRIFKSKIWDEIVKETAKSGKMVHLFGLLSDGNVHSHINQIFKLIDGIVASGVKQIRVHPLLDGRDVPPLSGLSYIEKLEAKLAQVRTQNKVNALIASGGGRMYVTMDRYYSDWNIVKRGWFAHVRGVVQPEDITKNYPGYFKSAKEAIETAQKVYPEKQDQYNPPFVIVDDNKKPVGKMQEGDAVINYNFRGDRAIEISKAFVESDFKGFDRVEYPRVKYAGLLEYDSETHLPPKYLVQPPDIQNTLGQFLCSMKVPSFAIAETHKFGHVTYFWNGNRTGYINDKYEKYIEIVSEPNAMIEPHPQMKAKEVTDKLIEAINSKQYKFIRVNYANGDMVGHTGNIQSCITAVKTVDESLARIVPLVLEQKGIVVLTADHGNVEEKLDAKGGVKTSHTLNPVMFTVLDGDYHGEYIVDSTGITTPGLGNDAATILNFLGFEAPDFYGKSLLKFK
jgi:2,3-bisphosphoglycerate-independent phosphoglycerate mutase